MRVLAMKSFPHYGVQAGCLYDASTNGEYVYVVGAKTLVGKPKDFRQVSKTPLFRPGDIVSIAPELHLVIRLGWTPDEAHYVLETRSGSVQSVRLSCSDEWLIQESLDLKKRCVNTLLQSIRKSLFNRRRR
jgi:hypothetical protein